MEAKSCSAYESTPEQEPITIEVNWRINGDLAVTIGGEKQVLYVKVGQGLSPVLNADVKAVINRPNDDQGLNVILRDDGTGRY